MPCARVPTGKREAVNRNLSPAQFHARYGAEYPNVGYLGRAYSKMGGQQARPSLAKPDREWWTFRAPEPKSQN